MRFLFLNQYAPPDPVPTARLLGELAAGLRAEGHGVEIVSQRQSYQGRPSQGGRLRRELLAAWTILRIGWKATDGKPDVVLALSSPPGLLVVGALVAWRHQAQLAHWAMDLYPELALALGDIRTGGLVARGVGAGMRWAYRRASLVVALDEDMHDHLQAISIVPVRVLPPWPAKDVDRKDDYTADSTLDAVANQKRFVCLYSGNLGRAHEWQTLLDSQELLEQRGLPIILVFQGDGAGRAPAMACAQKIGLRNCEWKGYVAEQDLLPSLLAAQVLVVTQRPETRGLLWPSKLALLERLAKPILFIGPEHGAIAARLRSRGNAGIFSPGKAEAVARWLEAVFRGEVDHDTTQRSLFPTAAEQPGNLRTWLVELGRTARGYKH